MLEFAKAMIFFLAFTSLMDLSPVKLLCGEKKLTLACLSSDKCLPLKQIKMSRKKWSLFQYVASFRNSKRIVLEINKYIFGVYLESAACVL